MLFSPFLFSCFDTFILKNCFTVYIFLNFKSKQKGTEFKLIYVNFKIFSIKIQFLLYKCVNSDEKNLNNQAGQISHERFSNEKSNYSRFFINHEIEEFEGQDNKRIIKSDIICLIDNFDFKKAKTIINKTIQLSFLFKKKLRIKSNSIYKLAISSFIRISF
jgi:hypothetical protein